MYDENQMVPIKWNNTNREWYESKGYVYTKRYDELKVQAKDLCEKSSSKIKVTCDYCGSEYTTQYASIVKGRKILPKDACRYCAGLKTKEVSLQRRAREHFALLNDICEQNGYTLLTEEKDYTDAKMDIEFVCPKHGKQKMTLDNLIHGHECIRCSYEKRFDNVKYSVSFVKNEIEKINGNISINPEDYKNVFTRNMRIRCKCGNEFTTSFANYMRYGVNRCPACSQKESNPEVHIRNFLETNNIEYCQEKRFEDCKDSRTLPFDFYLPTINAIIEFDGIQHYSPIYGDEQYASTVKHDKIKNEYCQSHGIHLLRIPYWEMDNIENIITSDLESIIGKRYSLVS